MQNLTTSSVCGCGPRTGFSAPFSPLQCAYSSLYTHPIFGLECCRRSSCRAGVGVSAVKRRKMQETRGGESKRRKFEALGAALSSFGAVEVSAESQRPTATTTSSMVGETPRARTSWTFNVSQHINQGRGADPGLVPLCLMTKHTFSSCHSPVGVHRPGAYRSERGVPRTPLLRQSCALRSKETITGSLRSVSAAALTHQLLVAAIVYPQLH